MSTVTARCACGKVRFDSEGDPLLQFVCHCSDCRSASKNDFTITAFFLAETSVASGDVTEHAFTAASGSRTTRESCSECGTFMFDKSSRFPTLIGVVAQTLAAPFVAEPSCHVWVNSKLSHVSIPEDLPQHPEDIA